MSLSVPYLQAQARQALDKHHTPPQRYGTAFHLTPPVSDLRKLDPTTVAGVPPNGWQAEFAELPLRYQEQIMGVDLSDVYLAWQLAHMSAVPVQVLRVPAGQSVSLRLSQAGVSWIFLEEGARLALEDRVVGNELALSRLFVRQKATSTFLYTGLRAANMFLSEKVEVHLAGYGAAATVTHFIYGTGREQADIETRVYHTTPHTQSSVAVRIAGQGNSRSIYRGLIDVDQRAPATEGYQSARGLLLSRQAVIDALPELAIRTNDVRCSHGVALTHLDDVALFYLRSRGLSALQAKEQALLGFFHHQLEVSSSITRQLENILLSAPTAVYANSNNAAA